MADNVTIPAQGTGDTTPVIAADEVSGAKWQRMKVAVGADGFAQDSSEIARLPVTCDSLNVGTRHPPRAFVLCVEDFRNPSPSVWNDACGGASRDTEVCLGGLPTMRLDTQGLNANPASPAAPVQANLADAGAGGGSTLGAATYFYKVTGVSLSGESVPSNEKSIAIAANHGITVTWAAVDGYSSYNIYRSTTTGTEILVATVSGNSTITYLDLGATSTGVSPPGATTAINPGRTANVTGVVAKRRIHENFLERIGLEVWFRLTSTNNTTNTYPTLSVYNRDGTSAFHGRIWLRPQGNNLPLDVLILDGAATAAANAVPLTGGGAAWRKVDTSDRQNSSGTHLYEPFSGRMDRAGGWHWAKLVVDFSTQKYVSCQLDGRPIVDLSAYNLDQTTTAGFAGMHCSFEYCAGTTTPRYMHTARWVITKESLA